MSFGWLMNAAVLAEALPGLAALRARRSLSRARLGVLAWSGVLLASNAVDYWTSAQYLNNHWTSYVAQPIEGALVLWVLSRWQVRSVARLTIQLLIPLYLLAMLALTIVVERLNTYSIVTNSVTSLLILALSLYTLLTCSLIERGRLTRFDWFWICSGMALFYGSDVAIEPFSRAMMSGRVDLVIAATALTSALELIALLAIAQGMLCPNPPLNSGGSSPPRSSPLPFSSRHSVRPS
jgi:hypothetical protein